MYLTTDNNEINVYIDEHSVWDYHDQSKETQTNIH